ncbi:hypothetical protein [Nocardia sp. NPDC059195]|uniref:hypothetical protein n=1 Tax=Nocardia sp. NPDC059195 TaxID=3346765 RepID=UPI00368C2E33
MRNISGCVADAIDGFFQRVVDSSLNPLLELLSKTLLTTPEPGELPRVGELWDSSWQLVVAMYGLLVMAAGVLLMVRETLQTRYSLQELLPRIVVGFIAGAMSLLVATQAIRFANALAGALAGEGVDTDSAAAALTELASTGPQSGIFLILLQVVLVVMIVVLIITYVVRVAVTVILVVAAPLALMCHALPGLDSVARWWWRSFAACLAIQVVQSLVLVTVLRVFLTPGGWEFFGPNANGIVSLIIGIALFGVLIKVPFWLLSTMRIGQGRGMVGSLVRGYVTYKTFGLLKGGEKAAATAVRHPRTPRSPGAAATATRTGHPRGGRRGVAVPAPVGGTDPYARTRSTRDGQLMLPFEGVRRTRPTPPPTPPPATSSRANVGIAAPGTQSTRGPSPRTTSPRASSQGRAAQGRQLALDFRPPDPYAGIRADRRTGQYPLPIPVTRVRPAPNPVRTPGGATSTPSTPSPVSSSPRPARGRQMAFDFDPPDPYERNQPLRNGQYRLPFPVHRVRPADRPPTPPVPPPVPQPRPAPTPTGRQLHLPLPDLPVRRRARRNRFRGGDSR